MISSSWLWLVNVIFTPLRIWHRVILVGCDRVHTKGTLATWGNTIPLSISACVQVSLGVAALFGPQQSHLAGHINSMCNALDVPHLEARLETRTDSPPLFSVNLYPDVDFLTKAYIDVVTSFEWKRILVLYADDYGKSYNYQLASTYCLFYWNISTVTVILQHKTDRKSDTNWVISELQKSGDQPLLFNTHMWNIPNWMHTVYWQKATHGPAHFLRVRSAIHLQYMNGRHNAQQTRHEARVKCSYDARMSRRCCANVMRLLCECYAYVVQIRRASYARHSSSKCDVKCAGCAHHTRCTRREKRAS
jgi:hypothetical protein